MQRQPEIPYSGCLFFPLLFSRRRLAARFTAHPAARSAVRLFACPATRFATRLAICLVAPRLLILRFNPRFKFHAAA